MLFWSMVISVLREVMNMCILVCLKGVVGCSGWFGKVLFRYSWMLNVLVSRCFLWRVMGEWVRGLFLVICGFGNEMLFGIYWYVMFFFLVVNCIC